METSVLDIANLIRGFELSCQTEGKSPKTIEWYKTTLMKKLNLHNRTDLIKFAIRKRLITV